MTAVTTKRTAVKPKAARHKQATKAVANHQQPPKVVLKQTEKQREAVDIMNNPEINRVLLYGGSRSGKSMIIIIKIIMRAVKEMNSRHLIVRSAFAHCKNTIWLDTLPKAIELLGLKGKFVENKTDYLYRFNNGSEIWIGGLDDKDRTEKLLGSEYNSIYFNEISQIRYDNVLIALTRLSLQNGLVNKAYFDCNPPSARHWSYKLFIQRIDAISNAALPNPQSYGILKMNPDDNKVNLATGYIDETLAMLPKRQRDRFLLGNFATDIDGALWTEEIINTSRVTRLPEMRRIVIGVDPAVTSKADSDETGIITVGKGYDDHYYVLQDDTGRYTPNQWAQVVSNTFVDQKADGVIGEVNNGGDLIEANIRTVNPQISYKAVHATRGKALRAEPIVALYEQGKVHHVGMLDNLETEMITWSPINDTVSPNRVDALVWAITELSGTQTNTFFVV